MKPNVKEKIHLAKLTKRLLAVGGTLVLSLFTASAVVYIGAGTLFEYYRAMVISGAMLGYVRTAGVLLCAGALAAEYTHRSKQSSE